jgi:hypothetical protein
MLCWSSLGRTAARPALMLVCLVVWLLGAGAPSALGALLPDEVELPAPALTEPRKACNEQEPALCPGSSHYRLEDTTLPLANERNAMRLRTGAVSATYTKGEQMFASFSHPSSTGYDRYRVEATIGKWDDGTGYLENGTGADARWFTPFLCFEPNVNGNTFDCYPGTRINGSLTLPYELSHDYPVAGEIGYRTRVGWRYNAGSNIATTTTWNPSSQFKMTAVLRWLAYDDTAPTINKRVPFPGQELPAGPVEVSASTFDAGAGMHVAELLIDGQRKGLAESDATGPRLNDDPATSLPVEYSGELSAGQHAATITATDWLGHQSTTTWTFSVAAAPPASTDPPLTDPPLTEPLSGGDEPFASITLGRQRISAVRRSGFKLRLGCIATCRAGVRLALDGKTARRVGLSRGKAVTVGRTSARLPDAGDKRVTIPLHPRAGRALAKLTHVRLALRATVTGADGHSLAIRRQATLNR